MDLLATLRRSGGIDALARQIGLPPPTVSHGAGLLLPALVDGLRGQVRQMGGGDGGLAALLTAIDDLGDGGLAVAVMGPGPVPAEPGERILAHFLESSDAASQLSRDIGAAGSVDAAELRRILPLLAMLVCGYVSARAGSEGLGWLRELLAGDEPRGGLSAKA